MPIRMLAGKAPVLPSQSRANQGLCIVCMGPSGAGKTTLLETLLPKYGPLAVMDVDGKAHVLRDREDLDIYSAHTWSDIDKLAQDITRNKHGHKTVCWDGTTLMQAISQDAAGVPKQTNAQMRQNAYGVANVGMVSLANNMRILAELGMNVIFNVWCAQEEATDPETSATIKRLEVDLTPTLLTRFIGIMDFVVYLGPAPGLKPYPPLMRTGGSQSFATKSALSPDSPLREMPTLIYNPSWTSIIDSFHGEPWPRAKHTKGGG